MNKNIYLSIFLLLVSLLCVSTGVRAATEITIPTTSGSYVNWNDANYSGCKVENSGANIGSTGSSTEVSFTIKNETQQSYVISFKSGAKETATWGITLNDDSKTWLDATADIPNIGDYTLKTPFAYVVSNLPAGTYTLKFKVNSTDGKYAGNIGNLAITALTEYDKIPSTITLANGTYNGPRVESAGNVGYVKSGGTATYMFYNPTAQYYKLNAELYRLNQGGNVKISIQDATSGTSEYNENYVISPDAPGSYTATDLATVKLTEGLKVMTLTFSGGSSYICNYQNLKFDELTESATIKSGFKRTSFSSSYPIDFSRTEGIKAYIVTSTGDNSTAVEEVTSVPANTGVILESQSGAVSEDTSFKLYTAATASLENGTTNLLQAALAGYTVQSGETVYGYGKKNQEEGFYLYAPGRTVSAGKAYLKLTTASSAKPFFSFGAGSTTTDIEQAVVSQNEADGEKAVYNLAGQRVSKGYKGIVIKNGKKFIRK